MDHYKKVATIVIRGFSVSFLVSTAVEIAIIASDVLFVRTGLFSHSEIAFKPRVILAAFYFLAGMFLYSQSKTIGRALVQGLFNELEDKETAVDKLDRQN